jgi:hypothetical protein
VVRSGQVAITALLNVVWYYLIAVNDPEVRRFLRDERLQDILHSIDGADDREATLARYLESPEFQEFSNMLLTKIGDV